MKKYNYDHINEELYHLRLANGLNVYLLPKNDYSKTYVTFTTEFGSINLHSKDKSGNLIDLPSGIAHFLEHKLFEKDGEDVSKYFAASSASVNAFTQNNKTTYLFSCTDKLEENTELLLNLVQNPLFTTEGVEKEKGIIAQEIKMYEDEPSSVAYMGLIKNMFKSHPVRNDILGTIETIAEIDKDILEKAHNAYYSPENMVLFLAGKFDLDEIVKFITKNQESYKYNAKYYPVRDEKFENSRDIIKKDELKLDISVPNFLMGIKEVVIDDKKENIIKKELVFSILIDMFMGKSSKNFQSLLSKELINDSFGIDITFEKSYGFFLIGSDTNVPKELEKELKELFKGIKEHSFNEERFLISKKQIIGGFIHALNSIEFIANQFTKYYYYNQSLFDVLDILHSITLKDIINELDFFTNEEAYSTFTIFPKNSK